MVERLSFSAVLVTQGTHKFYTLTLESDVLAATCIVSTREKDPLQGFQRNLDKKRAEAIKTYIDQGGVIPGSIVLSAQESANIVYDSKKKTIQFDSISGAFLIIDGQHRVYGFSLSEKQLRVPVVIFLGLGKRDEVRLFIDINTLQRSVSSELLLDIKKLAESETEIEQSVRYIFDFYKATPSCYLYGLLSPTEKKPGYISRTTFLLALKPVVEKYFDIDVDKLAQIFNFFLVGLSSSLPQGVDCKAVITRPNIFRAVVHLFPSIAQTVSLKYAKQYSPRNFEEVLKPIKTLRKTAFDAGSGYKALAEILLRSIEQTNTDL